MRNTPLDDATCVNKEDDTQKKINLEGQKDVGVERAWRDEAKEGQRVKLCNGEIGLKGTRRRWRDGGRKEAKNRSYSQQQKTGLGAAGGGTT